MLDLPEGYSLETAGSDHLPAFRELIAKVALGQWNDLNLDRVRATIVPSGWQIVRHLPTGALVATGMAQRNPIADLYPPATRSAGSPPIPITEAADLAA